MRLFNLAGGAAILVAMAYVAACEFREAAKTYYMDPGEWDLLAGQRIVGETSRGLELGVVKFAPREMAQGSIRGPIRRVLRPATGQDLEREREIFAFEARALQVLRDGIGLRRLEMKPVKAEATLDMARLFFFYEAEGRVDFRDLLREAARQMDAPGMRLQFVQVNAREAAKALGGVGPCGKELCCSTFLTAMPPVTLKMAKDQGLSLTPHKISGACGRLMCCLRYEVDFYRDQKMRLPRPGSPVDTAEGPGTVVDVNLVSEKCIVELGDGRRVPFTGEELRSQREARGPVSACASHHSQGGSCTKSDKLAGSLAPS